MYLLGIVFILSSCSSGKESKDKRQAIPVRTAIVKCNTKVADQDYIGVMEEERSSAISFPINGTIEQLYAAEGQQVNKGALLAELNTSNPASSYAAAKAQLEQAEDAMKRIQMLYDNESVPEVKFIEMKTNLEKATSMEAIAKKNMADSRLTAPFSGTIGQKRVEAGENVAPNQTVFTLLKIDPFVMVKVPVPEKEIGYIQLGQTAVINVSALNDERFEGIVAERGVIADPVSHTYTIKIKVSNTAKKLLPGMVCNVNIHSATEGEKIIVLPNNCIQRSGNKEKYVWCVVDGNAVKKPVQTGRLTSNGVEITSGLQGGEQVVTEGYQGLFDGATIRII